MFLLLNLHDFLFLDLQLWKIKISVKPKNVLKFAENATNPLV